MRMSIPILFAAMMIAATVGGEETLRSQMKTHCFRCHGQGKVHGKVNLAEAFATETRGLVSDLDLIEKMIEALAGGEMPPEEEKQPTEKQRKAWVTQLKDLLRTELRTRTGITRVPIRRMNRFEYNNAVKDLFQLARDPFALPERTVRDIGGYFKPATGKVPGTVVVGNRAMGKSQFIGLGNTLPGVAAFPKDNRAEHGFDNRGDHLTMSPVLMESFFALSQSIVNSPEFPLHSGLWKPIFVAPDGMPAERLAAEGKRRLKVFLRRAFRRDVTEEIAGRYHRHFLQHLKAGKTFAHSMKAAVSAAMVSPRFLYIYSGSVQNDNPKTRNDFELASRLSFFLWKTIPDEKLLNLASQGRLRDPNVLSEQADRMMNDRRLKNFCDSFPLQWLQLDQLVGAVPDVGRHRDYYFGGANGKIYLVGMHMMIEPLLLFETVLIENQPIEKLIDPDFTYQSALLKDWYHKTGKGRVEVIDIKFRRVPITDRRWGGVITNAAVMTMTSSPVRTKPSTRGAWLATAIFNDPPQPPPADVPEIEGDDQKLGQEGLTLRDVLKQHISNPECAACHTKIDPLGFALENYDPVGRWRDTYRGGLAIDNRGKLFNRHEFADIGGFKAAILAENDRFARAFASHLLSFALGRELDVGDRPSLDNIVTNAMTDDSRFRTMIREVVLSSAFTNTNGRGHFVAAEKQR